MPREYPKTENVFLRDPETHKLIIGQHRLVEFEQVAGWLVTEKINGENIRVLITCPDVETINFEIRGRSDTAVLPEYLVAPLISKLEGNKARVKVLLEELHGLNPDAVTCLYGEGYGLGIKKGGGYRSDQSLRIFDVATIVRNSPRWWRPWSTVQRASELTGIQTVPVIGHGMSIENITKYVQGVPQSLAAIENIKNTTHAAEGVVARTDPYLFTWDRQRVLFKLKTKDVT